uniref:Uncharacterized protein orf60a n=1 Tax=Chara vulgaris TaxID=55564 RepID=Q1ACI6_CHAVU|nr:hypothetical protein ChvuCp058 [Chara vulgaris]ABA61994.1 hypothetical protein [Chara vulgaris]
MIHFYYRISYFDKEISAFSRIYLIDEIKEYSPYINLFTIQSIDYQLNQRKIANNIGYFIG